MRTTITHLTALGVTLCLSASARADTFGSGPNAFTIPFVKIDHPNNPADTTGWPNPVGSVGYTYRMGKYEVSEDMINKANALGNLGIRHDNRGANKPATSIDWKEALKFVNWLNTSTGHQAAYKPGGQLWVQGEPGFDRNNQYRNSLAKYFLPSTDEWYKAAYYNPAQRTYYDYPTQSNTPPDGLDSRTDTQFDAVYREGGQMIHTPNDVTNVGKASAFGTFGQGGNVWEWEETDRDFVNDRNTNDRGIRGGSYRVGSSLLSSVQRPHRNLASPSNELGFRVASKEVQPPPTPQGAMQGDFNGDGRVEGKDFLIWQHSRIITDQADANGDGKSDDADLRILLQHFGQRTTGAQRASSVPEPSALCLVLTAMLGLALRRKTCQEPLGHVRGR